MNIEDSLLRDEQERTLTWAMEKLEKDGCEIDVQIDRTSEELSSIRGQLEKVQDMLKDLQDQRSAVDRKIEMANHRMATLDTQPVRVQTRQVPLPSVEESNHGEATLLQHLNGKQQQTSSQQHSVSHTLPETGNAYHTVNIRCRGNTLELLRQIHLHTGVSEDTIMENAISAVAQAIEKNDYRMHFPLSVKMVQYEA